MLRREFLRRAAVWGVEGGIACCCGGCGTLFYSERCGQPHGGRIDWRVAALDGLGLILFFVPGVIAFVVDFSTGAIYLPEYEQAFPEYMPTPQEPTPAMSYEQTGAAATVRSADHWVSAPASGQPLATGQVRAPAGLKRVVVVRDELGPQRIEQVVTNHVRRPVSLCNSKTRISRLPLLDRFANQWQQHRANGQFGLPVKAFFEGLERA